MSDALGKLGWGLRAIAAGLFVIGLAWIALELLIDPNAVGCDSEPGLRSRLLGAAILLFGVSLAVTWFARRERDAG